MEHKLRGKRAGTIANSPNSKGKGLQILKMLALHKHHLSGESLDLSYSPVKRISHLNTIEK